MARKKARPVVRARRAKAQRPPRRLAQAPVEAGLSKLPDPLELKVAEPAEVEAIARLTAEHPEAVRDLDRNTRSVIINGRVFVGRWVVRKAGRDLEWSRAVANLPPSSADVAALVALPRWVELDRKTSACIIGDKLMIGTWQTRDHVRRLFWSQAGRLPRSSSFLQSAAPQRSVY